MDAWSVKDICRPNRCVRQSIATAADEVKPALALFGCSERNMARVYQSTPVSMHTAAQRSAVDRGQATSTSEAATCRPRHIQRADTFVQL